MKNFFKRIINLFKTFFGINKENEEEIIIPNIEDIFSESKNLLTRLKNDKFFNKLKKSGFFDIEHETDEMKRQHLIESAKKLNNYKENNIKGIKNEWIKSEMYNQINKDKKKLIKQEKNLNN